MKEVVSTSAVFFSYALLAIFAQNAVFTRALGVSRMVQLVGDDRTSSALFGMMLCITQVLVAPVAFLAGRFIAPLDNRAQLRPLVYIASIAVVCLAEHLVLWLLRSLPRRAQLLAWAAAQPGRYILEGDYDSEFRFDTRPLPSLQGMAGPNGPVVYLTTYSKSLAPGIRIACMVLPQSLLARYRRDFATYANTVSRFEQQTLCEFMAGGYFTRHLARMRLAYKRRMEAFAAALRAALPGVELDGVRSGQRAMVAAAAQQGVRLRGVSEYYLARPELCREDTVVAGYSALREEDVERVAQALARAWLCAPGNG